MNLKLLMTIVFIAAPATAQSDFAVTEGENDYTRPGFYLQGAGMQLINSFEPSGTSPKGAGFTVGIGWRFSPWYAVQIDYQWGEMDASGSFVNVVSDVSGGVVAKSWSVMATGKLYPFASAGIRFQPYAQLGLGVLDAESATDLTVIICQPTCGAPTTVTGGPSDLGFAMKYGGGADLHLTERIYVYVDYAFYHSIQDSIKGFDFHAFGGGVGFRW